MLKQATNKQICLKTKILFFYYYYNSVSTEKNVFKTRINKWMSEWLLFNDKWAMFQLYQDMNMLLFNDVCVVLIFILLAYL
jgi:hypothetical protein